jgi:fatty-acyl-CoA synthase/long-chain acyl-CoA synthetase
VEVVLFDEEGAQVDQPHVPGELFVRSKTVFDTYYKAPEKFEEDRRGAYHTVSDVAYFDDDGFFYICDRKKDMIISGGMNIYPAEIEAALEHHPLIADVAAFARDHLAGYKVPRSVSFSAEIPRTGSGKILKRVLRDPYWKGHESRVL